MICRQPVPNDDQSAWKYVDKLTGEYYDDERKVPSDFIELYNLLTEKYPCLDSLPEEEIDEGVWSDAPLINNFSHDLAILGVSYSFAGDVIPFIKKTANKKGFVFFDPQEDSISRP